MDPVVAASGVPVAPVRLPAGGSQLLAGGAPVPVTVVPNAPSSPTGVDVSGPGFFIRLAGRGDLSDPLGLTDRQVLVLQSIQSRKAMGGTQAWVRGDRSGGGDVGQWGGAGVDGAVVSAAVDVPG